LPEVRMPLYEYRCRACGARFEVLQRVGADAADLVCPQCGGNEVSKQYSTFASAVAGGSGGAMPCGASSSSSCGSGGFS
jgi:putative FmdB family regulatory protein